MPLVTHLAVVAVPFAPVRARRSPFGELTCISTTPGPTVVQLSLVRPTPEPSHTWIGLGSAVIEAFFAPVDGGAGALVLLGVGPEQPAVATRLTVRIMN